ncbi:hypothetical protein XENORESO_004906 [Xenotaenia resolanae]|uniref:Uncharacterized protein n=1 Tax=Xenotaenia resolanae TaxID=208358 RepID=A0ABV0W776_9TELE
MFGFPFLLPVPKAVVLLRTPSVPRCHSVPFLPANPSKGAQDAQVSHFWSLNCPTFSVGYRPVQQWYPPLPQPGLYSAVSIALHVSREDVFLAAADVALMSLLEFSKSMLHRFITF